MKEYKNRKGFTLAELLIVVAIIGVLVAISIPIFSNQIKKARLATNQANARAAYAAFVAQYMDEGMPSGGGYYTYDLSAGKIAKSRPKNFGYIVGTNTPKGTDAVTDISSWTVNTHAYDNSNLGRQVYKYWQMYVKDGKIICYYAWK